MILSLGEKIKESADLFFAKGVDQFNSKMYTAADSELDRAYAFYSIYSKVTALWETRVVLLKNLAIESKSTDLVKEKLPQYLYAVERLKEIDTYREIGNLMNSLPTTAMADTASKDVITASREKIRGIERSISEHKLKWTNYKQYYESVASLKFRVNTQVTEASAMVQRLDNLFTLVRREDIRFVNAYNFIEYNELKKTLEDYKRMYGEAAGLNEGYDVVVATIKDEKGREVKITRKEKHPTEALQKLNDLKFSVEEFMRRSDSFLNAVKSDEVLKSDKEEYTIWVKNGRAVVRGAEGLTGKINSAIQDADNLIILAKRYKNEGMLRLNQAQAYLKTERFDDSKDSIKLASRAFETSLKRLGALIVSPKKKLVCIDEWEAATEADAAAKIIAAVLDMFYEQGNSYVLFVSHLSERIAKLVSAKIRVDGIEAKGLDEHMNLIVDRNPKYNYHARSMPELILQRLSNVTKPPLNKVFTRILKLFSERRNE